MLEQPAAGLLLDPGLGKTAVALAATRVLQAEGAVGRVLVIAPMRVAYSVWPAEVEKWDDFTDLRVSILHGPSKDERLRDDADIFVINPEGLAWLEQRKWKHLPDMLVVDESTKFKNTRSKRFRVLRRLLPQFKRRYILTGTPAPNGLMDLFGQVYVLDLGKTLGRYITYYRQEYFFPTGYGGYHWALKPGAERAIYEKIAPLTLRLQAEDYLEMPELVKTDLVVSLPEKSQAQYQELEKELILELREGKVVASNAGALTSKCRQAANGAVYLEITGSERQYATLHDAKLDVLSDLLEELQGQPTLLAYEFEHDLRRIQQRVKDLPVIGGETSAKQGKELTTAWNRGQLPVLAVHPLSVGHGLNLQTGGHHIIFFGLTWNLEAYDQLIRRLWRQGQEKPVMVYHLVTKNTIDELVLRTLARKDRTQRDLLDALRGMTDGESSGTTKPRARKGRTRRRKRT